MNEETRARDSDAAGDAAIEWFVRLRAGNLSAREKADFERWRDDSEENATAFEEVLQMYGHLASMSPSRRTRTTVHPWRRYVALVPALAAASLALLINFSEVRALLQSDYRTGVGEGKVVALDDGSRVQLDSRSSIALRYGPTERRVILLGGEAWFDVASNAARPFVVEAAGGTVTALGTAFDVALGKSGARVIVTEHSVRVSRGDQEVVVTEGQQSAYGADAGVEQPSAIDAPSATAWRRGKLIVEKQPLGEVLEMLGRYRRGAVYCLSASICARRVSGVFASDDPLQSLREIEASLGLRMIYLTSYLILLY
jgi:transmembrane sensor